MIDEALKLILSKDAEEGTSWSDDSDEIAEIMGAFAKAQIAQLLQEMKWINRYKMELDYSDLEYIVPEELNDLIESWEAKL